MLLTAVRNVTMSKGIVGMCGSGCFSLIEAKEPAQKLVFIVLLSYYYNTVNLSQANITTHDNYQLCR